LRKQIKIKSFKAVKWCLTLPLIRNHTDSLLQKARSYFGSGDYNSAPEVMRKTLVSLVNDDMTDIVGNISCPTLLIWGDKDTDTPLYMAHKLTELIKDTGLCVLENTGHFSFVQKPFQANAILKSFLS
ncbi:MAG: alpha/beta hydrolase, partial [bacterium]|nr:alpha/beta hydrolase [bacterium]